MAVKNALSRLVEPKAIDIDFLITAGSMATTSPTTSKISLRDLFAAIGL
jgi:hypothetical protein